MTLKLHPLLPTMALGAVVFLFVAQAAAADPAAKPDAGDKAAQSDKTDRSLREQNVYIPYEKLRQVFEKHGRGVFLPYEQFEELWRAAQDKTRPAAEQKPPVAALITEIDNEATVSRDVVRVKATVKIDLLAEGWHEIPLRLGDAAITSATLRGEPARIIGGPGEGHRLLVEKKGKQPEQIELTLEYAKAIARTPGQNSVSFEAPQAPVSRWKVRIPQSGVKVNFQPLIAATEVPGEQAKTDKKTEETVILAFAGAAPTVRIDWTPKAEGAVGLAALASVQAEQQVWLNEGAVRTHANLAYTIDRAELAQLVIEVPGDYQVVNVVDANVRQWSVQPAAGTATQRITVQLAEPAKGSQQVRVELERFVGQKRQDSLKVPTIRAIGVGRQQGVVVVQVAPGLRAEASRTSGMTQEDAARLPGSLSREKWDFAYQYAAIPYELELSIEQVQPRIAADSLVEARLEPERLGLDWTVVYTIERAGVFKLELDLPPGYDVRQVRGREIASKDPARGAAAVSVESHHIEGEKKNHLAVNLARKATGRVALLVQLQKELHEEKLLVPVGKAGDGAAGPRATVDIPLPLPAVAGGVERATGRLVVYATESLQVNLDKADLQRSIPVKQALEAIPSAQQPQKSAEMRPVHSLLFAQEPGTVHLAVERRLPSVTIRQLLVARIEEGVIKYQATLHYTILYSGVKSLRIDLPADVAATARVTTSTIQKQVLDSAAGLDKDYVAWRLSGNADLTGEGTIEIAWEEKEKIAKLGVGGHVDLFVRPLVPREVDRAWGQIVFTKAETLDVHEADEPKDLRPIDPQHDLMAEVSGAARAFEFHGDGAWKLPITVTRYALQEVKRTSIDRGVVRMVITPTDEIAVQALYCVRSARQQLKLTLPDTATFDTDPLRVHGQPVALGRGQTGEYFVPLLATNADKPFLLEVRYTVPGDGRQLDLPAFPEDTAVQKIYLCAFVPATRALLGTTGPWTDEFQWRLDGTLNWTPLFHADDKDFVRWVSEGAPQSGTATDAFHTDGQLYVFSTLRPATDRPSDETALRLATMDHRGLRGALFFVIVLGGVLLLRAGTAERVLTAGALLVVLVLAGVFSPTFSLQILNGALLLAVFIVLVIWGVAAVFRMRPAAAMIRDAIAARLAARRTAAPPVVKPKPETVEAAPTPSPEQGSAKPEGSEGGPSHA